MQKSFLPFQGPVLCLRLAQVPDEATLAALDKECETLDQTLKTTLLEKDEITKQRAQIQSTPTNSELKAEVQHLAETTHAQTKQLQECESAIDANKKAGKGKTLSTHRALAADKKTLDQTLRVVERAACKRKRSVTKECICVRAPTLSRVSTLWTSGSRVFVLIHLRTHCLVQSMPRSGAGAGAGCQHASE